MSRAKPPTVDVRRMSHEDLLDVIDLYAVPGAHPKWDMAALLSQLACFPHGQFVAEHRGTGEILGAASSLILTEAAAPKSGPWLDPCARGDFTGHDPEHGAVLWAPSLVTVTEADWQDTAIALDDARRALAERLGMTAVLIPVRLSGSGGSALNAPPERFAKSVNAGKVAEPLLRLLLKQGYILQGALVDADAVSGTVTQEAHVAVVAWRNPHAGKRWLDRHATHFLQPDVDSL
ncbi:MAG: hypothetical protein H7338_06285 [Candidatus Sericytochromatia bacterium]|nr:hypothetical protein [Candidatus Sericytochromatia bacterium]